VQSLVDALSSLVGVPSDRLSELISQLPAGIPSEDLGASKSVGVLVGVLKALQPVTPGQVSRIPLHLANDNAEADECSLWSTDLIGPSGRRIPAAHVRVIPQPIRVPGGGSTDIQIEVRVPSETAAGDYTGLLQSDDGNAVRALVHISVRR
jgi:hypothetical protein